MEEYKPNSHRYREEKNTPEKKVEKVVTGVVKTKKKNKFADAFVAEDFKKVGSYAFGDVLIPAIKKAIYDIVTDGIDMILYGENRSGKKTTADKISYRKYYDREYDRTKSYGDDYRNRNSYSHDDIILENRGEAEEVLARMDELIETYGVVSVADMYDLVGKLATIQTTNMDGRISEMQNQYV